MKKIVIASACRTAIGKFGGTLANVPAAELGSIVIKEALNRANVKPEQVDHVYMGCGFMWPQSWIHLPGWAFVLA